ncbi:AlpA family phage regulatory protein [Acinetobacter wanghuae]|uniref:AlpA family phage regulatory protein n=1 Tax=Acinetobacter wanghuae TaxID=2662362 RepID=A0A5Q0P0U5_9GAMM|nr:AlpA family phage regulatory protein [Acinetobacter wanghuae]MQW93383.1 AlpA family phage regulatory protein [Acinetobacter wanghuae]QGA10777.1 AlpA family phage regulatory protein [Acinetobacter wanghuae]
MLKRYNEVCDLLSLSRTGLQKLMQKDPLFPTPLKMGDSRQSPTFFIKEELDAWLETKKAERNEVTK